MEYKECGTPCSNTCTDPESSQMCAEHCESGCFCPADNIKVFKPSTFFILVHTPYGLQLEIQLVPIMQLYITVDVSLKGQLLGLCGDFNDVEADDFKTNNGLIAGTAVTFANSWKSQPTCLDATNKQMSNPCSFNAKKEKYAKYWCSLLSDQKRIFSPCHSRINPEVYEASCIHDTCNCENSEDCMCAALSSYVHACEAAGVSLDGWRETTCNKYSTNCPEGLVYHYHITSCRRSCRSLSQSDVSCQIKFAPVDGCGCAEGTYLNEVDRCVPASQCPCYDGDMVIHPGHVVRKQGITW
ncbi:Mucin-5AC [Merluccius polli]|uniref:Mucin-5AC n=1 Tax=Merluccius polli TaxID=89951 RepID=A0AA47MKM4_MERPO|nr:Mucin-5AC [Merluccius polli]